MNDMCSCNYRIDLKFKTISSVASISYTSFMVKENFSYLKKSCSIPDLDDGRLIGGSGNETDKKSRFLNIEEGSLVRNKWSSESRTLSRWMYLPRPSRSLHLSPAGNRRQILLRTSQHGKALTALDRNERFKSALNQCRFLLDPR